MMQYLEFVPLMMAVNIKYNNTIKMGTLIFHFMVYEFKGREFIPDFCSIGISSFNFLFPTSKLNRWLFKLDDDTANTQTYDYEK